MYYQDLLILLVFLIVIFVLVVIIIWFWKVLLVVQLSQQCVGSTAVQKVYRTGGGAKEVLKIRIRSDELQSSGFH